MISRCLTSLWLLVLVPALLFGQVIFNPPFDGNQRYIFPDTPVGASSEIMLNVSNNGRDQCQVMLQRPGGPFAINNFNLILQPGQIGVITITFAPQQAGDFEADLGGMLAISIWLEQIGPVRLVGSGVEDNPQPAIIVDPEEFRVIVEEDLGPVEETLVIGNVGDEALVGEIVVPDLAWLTVEPEEFSIDAGDELAVTLTFGAEWPDNGNYETAITINSNDPENEALEIPILLSLNLPEYIDRVIQLPEGWSMISANLDFAPDVIDEEGPDLQLILSEIVDQVLIIKDEEGRFCAPPFNFWGLPQWSTPDGYLIKTNAETELAIRGEQIPFDRRIELERGWNMIAFYPTYELEFGSAVAELVEREQLIMLKNGRGEFLIPQFNFGWDFLIHPGEGIMVKVTEDCSFAYPPEPER